MGWRLVRERLVAEQMPEPRRAAFLGIRFPEGLGDGAVEAQRGLRDGFELLGEEFLGRLVAGCLRQARSTMVL
jgi:hypothetical protein